MKLKIGFASTDWSQSLVDSNGMNVPGGANWVRLQQVRQHLDAISVTGWLIWSDVKGFGISNGRGDVVFDFDVIVMQRLMFKNLIVNLEQNKLLNPKTIIVNDLDDWYWGLDPRNSAYSMCQAENSPDENIDHYKEILLLSDAVTVSTPFLANKVANDFGHPNVHIIENGVSVSDFTPRQWGGKQPTIGWVGSTNHRSGDLEELFGIFSNKFKFHHSGSYANSNAFADALGLDTKRVARSPMREPWQYAKLSFCFDIGLAPLSDIEFNHAKSWIKAIEYAASGIPFVASPRPEYVRLVEQLGVGRIAHNPHEWLAHVNELHDHDIRRKEGIALREKVSELFDVKIMADRWMSVISSLL